jgi:hypothetical protein
MSGTRPKKQAPESKPAPRRAQTQMSPAQQEAARHEAEIAFWERKLGRVAAPTPAPPPASARSAPRKRR